MSKLSHLKANDSVSGQKLHSKIIENRLYLLVKINDKLSGYMLFDNGASRCVIYKRHLIQLGLTISDVAKDVSLASGKMDIPIVDKVKVEIGDIYDEFPSSYIIDDNNNSICNNIIGTIGTNFLKKYNWSIDIKENEVFCKKEAFENKDVTFQDFPLLDNNNIFLQGKISNNDAYFYLDYGFDGELLFPRQHVSQVKLSQTNNLMYNFHGSLGMATGGGKIDIIQVLKINSITFGNVKIKEVNATVGDFNHLNLGTKFLRNFKVLINYTKNQIGFINKNKEHLTMLPNEDYGLDFAYDKQRDCFYISRIFDFYVQKNNFRIGQIVESINNKTVKDFKNKCKINNHIQKCRTKKSFQIKTNDSKYTLHLTQIPFLKM